MKEPFYYNPLDDTTDQITETPTRYECLCERLRRLSISNPDIYEDIIKYVLEQSRKSRQATNKGD